MSNTDINDAQDVPKGFWLNAHGSLIPVAKIKDIDKARDKVVKDIALKAIAMRNQLLDFKLDVMSAVAGFVQTSADEYGATVGGKKGNVTLVSFDGRYKVVRQVQDTIAFDERLQVAKGLIDECVHVWSKGANRNIQALINNAFQVDKQGQISTARVLGLRQLSIDDAKWSQAMAAIADSMRTVASKSYVRFYERVDATGEYIAIPLDVSAL